MDATTNVPSMGPTAQHSDLVVRNYDSLNVRDIAKTPGGEADLGPSEPCMALAFLSLGFSSTD